MLQLYEAIISTLLDTVCRPTLDQSAAAVSSWFKLASLPPTAAAAKFQSYRAYPAVRERERERMVAKLSQTNRRLQYRDGILIPSTTDRPVAPTGMAESANEETDGLIKDFAAHKLDVKICTSDVVRSHRVGRKTEDRSAPRDIIVRFTTHNTRRQLCETPES